MYLDIKGLVTVGIGNLLENISEAQSLPFVHANGKPATAAEIATEWKYTKSRTDLMSKGGMAYKGIHPDQLKLTPAGIKAKFYTDLDAFTHSLVTSTPEFASLDLWPADAQMALLSMMWAMGSGFARKGKWPKFRQACANWDWLTASKECRMKNAGLRQRNIADEILFRNAMRMGADDITVLHYPYVWDVAGRPTLSLKDKGYAVGAMQTLLLYHGDKKIITDGVFGPNTQKALIKFQGNHGISETGRADQGTWDALCTPI